MALKDKLYGVPVVGTALRVQDRYKQDDGNQLAAAMGFFGFLSLFPMLLLVLSAAGFVLADDPAQQQRIVSTIESAIPGLGAAGGDEGGRTVVGEAMQAITDNPGAVGLVGLVTLLLAGLRIVDSAMTATARIFRVRVESGAVKTRLRQLGALVGLGVLALAGVVAASSVGALVERLASPLDSAAIVVTPLVAVGLDFALFIVAYRVLAAGQGPAWRELVPGALLAAIGWTALKVFGATYVSGQVARANELYGTLGGVFGLLLLLFLAGRLYVYGAELAAVTRRPGEDLARRDDEVATVHEHRAAAPGAHEPARDTGERGRDTGGGGRDTGPPLPGETDEPVAVPSDPPDRLRGGRRRVLDPPPGPAQRSPAVTGATATRLQHADRRNADARDPHYVRKGLAFAIAAGSVAALVTVMRPGGDDDR